MNRKLPLLILLLSFPIWILSQSTPQQMVAKMGRGINSGKPSDASNIIIDDIILELDPLLGVNDIDYRDDASITLYPNPIQNILKVNASKDVTKIEVYNILGQKMLSKENSKSMDVSNLNKGIYITKIFQENNVISTKRFIKE